MWHEQKKKYFDAICWCAAFKGLVFFLWHSIILHIRNTFTSIQKYTCTYKWKHTHHIHSDESTKIIRFHKKMSFFLFIFIQSYICTWNSRLQQKSHNEAAKTKQNKTKKRALCSHILNSDKIYKTEKEMRIKKIKWTEMHIKNVQKMLSKRSIIYYEAILNGIYI